MAKIYTQVVRTCAECPRLMYERKWCCELRREIKPLPQVPPKDCPLPDAKEEANA